MSPKALSLPPPEPTVVWDAQGTPRSARFGDIYRNQGRVGLGGLPQCRHVFLQGCGLQGPQALWRNRPHWTVLETGFGLGLNFLATWAAWRADPQRSRLLHFLSVEAYPVSAADIVRSAAPWPELQPLAHALSERWWGLVEGVHRLRLDDGQVLLTLGIGPASQRLPELTGLADSVFLDGFSPDVNPDMWSPALLSQVAEHCHADTRLATWCVTRTVRETMSHLCFEVERVKGLLPKRDALTARYRPAEWASTAASTPAQPPASPAPRATRQLRCAVLGAGLSGSAVAHALAQRGWRVEVFEAGPTACSGASGLPAGLCAPHVSQDDSWLSRLTRAGVRATSDQVQRLLRAGLDYGATGVLERRLPRKTRKARLPQAWPLEAHAWSRLATDDECTRTFVHTALPDDEPQPLWHACGLWLKPARLVEAQLNHPGIQLHVSCTVLGIQRGDASHEHQEQTSAQWQLRLDARTAGPFDHVIVCAGPATRELLEQVLPADRLPTLTPVRGQLTWGRVDADLQAVLPASPVNGDGSFLGAVPGPDGMVWMAGSSFDRQRHTSVVDPQDHAENLNRLQSLLPDVAARLLPKLADGSLQAWASVRCTTPDRLPRVGNPLPQEVPGLHVLTGLGARGLSLSVLCAEWLAARLCHEPSPIEPDLSQRLTADRL
jgi:tRNA 5-methylaminomethyl-2-thiouridine biosynthesis bifunctional protein